MSSELIDMKVRKRNGKLEDIAFDKILNRIRKLGMRVSICESPRLWYTRSTNSCIKSSQKYNPKFL